VDIQFGGLLVIAAAAVIAPLLARLMSRRFLPPVVVEVLIGVLVGPQALGLVRPTGAVEVLYLLGFGFLLFLAGQEVEPRRFRGPSFRLAGLNFIVCLGLAALATLALRLLAPGADFRLLALALTATSVGVVVPVLRDAGEISTDFGQLVIMAGSVGEFGALLLLTILFSADPEPTAVQVLYVAVLGAVAIAGSFLLRRLWQSGWLGRVLRETDENTSQLRIRGAFLILLIFVALARKFGVDSLLGAFIAGIVLGFADSDDRPTQARYQGKLRAIGYGFLVPVFFIVTGVQFDVRSLFASASSLALLPALLVAILLARAAPALMYRRRVGTRPALAAGLLQATTLTFPVVVAEVGRSLDLLPEATAAALIGAALLSVLAFPAAALALRPWTRPGSPQPAGPADQPAAGRGRDSRGPAGLADT
jgi:Kef-type K+ transport system membrane component KefB